jgi:hypothetical protein
MNRLLILSKTINNFFNITADAISISCGFIKRKRKLVGSSFMKALVFGNLQNPNCSIEGMCQILDEDSINMSKQGLNFRFSSESVEFMELMFKEAMVLFQEGLQINCDILQQFSNINLLDSTYINLPSSMQDSHRGYGSSYKDRECKTKAGAKLQVVFDYLNQSLSKLDIKEGIRSDQGYIDHLATIKPNELWIADLGYFVPDSFKAIKKAGAFFISRYKSDTNIYDIETEKKIDLVDYLNNSGKELIEREVFLGKEAKIRVRLIATKLSIEQSSERRRKANKLAKSHGYKSSQKNQKLLDWSIFITNIPENKITSEAIMKIYKVRWQIELLFKLYKSNIEIENLKAKNNSYRVLCELYAKLCIGVIFHGIGSLIPYLGEGIEISQTKAILELQRRCRDLFLAIKIDIKAIENFLRALVNSWTKFSLKDKKRKKRVSTLSSLKLLTTSLT